MRRPLTDAELRVIGVLREANEPWLEVWEIAQRSGMRVSRAARALTDLRHRGLVARRPSARGLSTVECSLSASGVW
jgi:DNA-binding IclR family transcriptional regulator